MEMEDKKIDTAAEQALPVQELPADIPAEVRQKLAEDLNEEAVTLGFQELPQLEADYSKVGKDTSAVPCSTKRTSPSPTRRNVGEGVLFLPSGTCKGFAGGK